MKIISVGPAHPLRGGIADFNEQLTRSLQEQGHDATIFSYSLQYPNIFFPGKTQFSLSPAPQGISIETSLNSIHIINWIKVAKKIAQQQPDVVIIHYWMPFFAPALGTLARKIAHNSNAKIIGLCHNLVPHEKKPGDTFLTKYFTKHCHAFIALSHSVVDDIAKFAPKKPCVYSPHPLYSNFGEKTTKEIACKQLQLDPTKKYILFFGLVRKYKGLDLLLHAYAQHTFAQQNIQLLIAGEFYDNPQEYMHIIESYQLQENVIIRNEFIPQELVRHYFAAADIVAQTYHSATQSGITQIAFHFDVPMLVTNVGGLSEILEHNAMGYVCEKNPQDIAQCLRDFFDNNKFDTFSKAVERAKHLYSWKTFIERIQKLWE